MAYKVIHLGSEGGLSSGKVKIQYVGTNQNKAKYDNEVASSDEDATSNESKKPKVHYDWTKIAPFVEVQREELTCFRITPDKSITNYNNYKFFKDVFELDKTNNVREILKSLFGILRDILMFRKPRNFKIVYKPATNYVWYEIIMKHDSINFYVVCSKSNEDFVKLKLEQCFPNAPIEIADIKETTIPEENTVISDLKLQRHNYFSIRTDRSERAQPIEDILMNAEDVKEGDVLKFMLRVQPYDANYWSYKCEEWAEMVRKGKTPKRLRVTKEGIAGMLFGISEFGFQKLGELFRMLHDIAFKKPETTQIIVNHAEAERREIGAISKQTNYKQTAPVFKTDIKIVSHSKDETRRWMNLKSLSNSFVDLKDTNNSLVRTTTYTKPEKSNKVKELTWRWVYSEINDHKVTPVSLFDIDYNIMCDKELGKLNMLPTADIQRKFEGRMKRVEQKENPVPLPFRDESGIYIGKTLYKGKEYNVYIPDKNEDEFALPIIASGMMGVGKDTFAINWVVENSKKGRGSVVLDVVDEKGRGMTDALKKSVHPSKFVLLDFAHPLYTPYLDWGESLKKKNRFTQNRLATELIKFFETDNDGAGLQTERYLRNCVKALPDSSIIEMGMILTSEEVRQKAIQQCKERGDISTANFWEMYDNEGEGRQRQIMAPVFNRLAKLIDDLALRPIFGQKPNHSIDFDKWLSEGKVIVCKIPKVAFGTHGIRILSHWITVKTWLTKQVQLAEDRKCESILVINEPHQIFSAGLEETFKELFPESRKFGLQLLVLFHDIAQIKKDVFDIMVNSGANFILYKQKTDKAWRWFAHRIEKDYELSECMELEKFHAMVGFLANNRDQPVIRVLMNDMPWKRGCEVYDNEETVNYCLKHYHRPIEEVEKELQELEKMFLTKKKKKVTQR